MTIASVGCAIPGDFSEVVPLDSRTSLLDFEIILVDPDFKEIATVSRMHEGKPLLTDGSSFRVRRVAKHWRTAIAEAVRAGKCVFLLLRDVDEFLAVIGEYDKRESGAGRWTTDFCTPFDNYKMIPFDLAVTASHGRGMKLVPGEAMMADYWREFSKDSEYKVFVECRDCEPLIVTKSGGQVVGARIRDKSSGGMMCLLPYVELRRPSFSNEVLLECDSEGATLADEEVRCESESYDFEWTDEGVDFGRRFARCLREIVKASSRCAGVTPPPEWTTDARYSLPREVEIREEVQRVEEEIARLDKRVRELREEAEREASLRNLLFETGRHLEGGIVEALREIGFSAEPYEDSESEFDVVFSSPEGRCLGEAEGKESKAINVDKLRQLSMNVYEDFDRPGVKKLAKPVLFGNAHRLTPVADRTEFFTKKCLQAAKLQEVALVRTPDLFEVARYLRLSDDEEFAARCRRAIFEAAGEVVAFPCVPSGGSSGAS